jgi:hypothetical protein
MDKAIFRLIGVPVAGAFIIGVAALATAPAASAATTESQSAPPVLHNVGRSASNILEPLQTQSHVNPPVFHNAAKGTTYLLDHFQREHLDQPLLNIPSVVNDPIGWEIHHGTPVVESASIILTGKDPSGMGSMNK